MESKKHYSRIFTNADFLNRRRAQPIRETKPEVETWDEVELKKRCSLSKPNYARAGNQKRREIRARALSRDLRRFL